MTPANQGLSLAAVRLSGVDLGLSHVLEEAELARATTFRSPALRDAFIAGRIALRLHISALTGDSPESLESDYFCPTCNNRSGQGHGTPRYRLPSRPGLLRVSLSRSGSWCLSAAALDDRIAGIGVDIEDGPAADFDGFPSLVMTANERGQLEKVPPELKPRFQTRLWVRKEAVLKATGHGFDADPRAVRLRAPDEAPGVAAWPFGPPEHVHLHDLRLDHAHVAALCQWGAHPVPVTASTGPPPGWGDG